MGPETPSGFRVHIEVMETADKGLGVFTAETIKKGDIVWRHVPGNYTVYDEHMFRSFIGGLTNEEAEYQLTHMFGLMGVSDCVIGIHDAGALINHSNPANLATKNPRPIETGVDTTPGTYIRDVSAALLDDDYALVATRDIESGEELTTDYRAECHEPAWFNSVHEQYGVVETYLDDR